jgi:Polyketide cyclase / dehydrase and lipid transport
MISSTWLRFRRIEPARKLGVVRRLIFAAIIAFAGHRGYRLLTTGAATIDVGTGRRLRSLGPCSWDMAASRELVFDVIARPYLGRTPRALEDKLQVWERGSDMVLAAHFTPIKCGVTTTLETVRFDRPARIDFRVVRGPVPHVVESFVLDETEEGTRLTWSGELGTDFWALGAWWGNRVALAWDKAVRSSLEAVAAEAERRATAAARSA